MRKIIQISTTTERENHDPDLDTVTLHALCDDGTLWLLGYHKWVEIMPIPQDKENEDHR